MEGISLTKESGLSNPTLGQGVKVREAESRRMVERWPCKFNLQKFRRAMPN
jgi:hypothetical protein